MVVGGEHVEVVAGVAGGLARGPRRRGCRARIGKLQHLHRQIPAQRIAFLAFDRRSVDGDAVDEISGIGDEQIDAAADALDGVEALLGENLGVVFVLGRWRRLAESSEYVRTKPKGSMKKWASDSKSPAALRQRSIVFW